jgi:hypothetical protein
LLLEDEWRRAARHDGSETLVSDEEVTGRRGFASQRRVPIIN